ncbi:alpha/beta fold hydrolase [Nitratireductor pacificus]|uniref:Alpha/beta hydrolase fold protein n=1 Tax=Nitratireductor pacificus pht-3B TaxID=391937 RepID=K2LRX7_9HYPH|nr:alpha/beta hydrolase [Nitratireductor pacificus]EKF20544.1 alpha/beta hydrolase fold protein [Nitratireductor pacificus pht-3B]
MAFADIENGRLYYEVIGEGKPLFLISGLGGVGEFWRSQAERLASRFRVVLHDHRGTGSSTTLTTEYSVELMAADVMALMDHLGVEQATMIGHSTGGIIAQTLAAFHPQRVDDLVLSASWAHGDAYFRSLFELRLAVLKAAGMDAYERLGRLFRYPPWFFEDRPDALAPARLGESGTEDVIASRIGVLLSFDSRAFLSRIGARTLVIGAEDDAVTPRYLWNELAEKIENAVLATLPTGGHFCPQTQPDLYHRHLLDFLLAETADNRPAVAKA